jgi:hypothetical protein
MQSLFESKPCNRWLKLELQNMCDELNIPYYSRYDTKAILCKKISDHFTSTVIPTAVPTAVPRFINSELFAQQPRVPRSINPVLFAQLPQVPRSINPDLFKLEEDQEAYTNIKYKNKPDHEEIACINENFYSLEPYTSVDETIQIFTLDNKNEYKKSACISYSELYELLNSDFKEISVQKEPLPATLKSIYRFADHCDTSGRGCVATGKIVIKMPPNNIMITHGSLMRIISSPEHNWYALPLYGGKKRRIGNVSEIYASSVDHGQVPGHRIYKLFTKREIEQGVLAKPNFPESVVDRIHSYESEYYETADSDFFDYTMFEHEQNSSLTKYDDDVKAIITDLFTCYTKPLEAKMKTLKNSQVIS